MKRHPVLIALSVLPWAVAIAALGWLLVQRFPPSGTISFRVPFDGRGAWIHPFLPSERVSSPGLQSEGWRGQRILGDPVYTTARVPGVYDSVEVEMEFRPVRQPLVELGIVKNLDAGEIAFTPVWFEPLQDARWNVMSGGYAVANPGARDTRTTAVWRATSTMPALMDDPAEHQTTRVTLRGAHDLYVVPVRIPTNDVEGRISFTFEIQDANRSRGADAVLFRMFRGNEQIASDALGVGGSRDTRMGTLMEKTIELDAVKPGVYRIQLIADDDVFIRSITTDAKHWVLGPRLVFGDDVGFATSTHPGNAWTDSRHLVVETFHREGLQSVTVGGQFIAIERTHEPFHLDRTDADTAIQPLRAPKGDVRIIGDGWFSFSPETWFAPQSRRITDRSDPVQEGITRVITPYVRPEALGDGWYRAKAVFPLDPTQDTIRLALSTPGITSRTGAVDIREVRLTYTRPPLSWAEWWRVLEQEARNAFRRLR